MFFDSIVKLFYPQLTGNEVNIDIIKCFPGLLCQYVFQHLDGKELLEMSLVSKTWNHFVSQRPQIGKLKLVIDQKEKLTLKEKKILQKSKRQYQNIKITVFPKEFDFWLAFFTERAGWWKTVDLEACEPMGKDLWLKILQVIEPSVDDLSLTDWCHSKETSKLASCLTFPHLKFLNCNVRHHNIFKHFVGVKSLDAFGWCLPKIGKQVTVDIKTILRNNINLTAMFADTDWEFFNQLSNIKFKLQRLAIHMTSERKSAQSFMSFLKSQAKTLEWLDFNVFHPTQAIWNLVFSGMPKLTSLKTGTIIDPIGDLPANSTITSLEIDERIRSKEMWLIAALENLKHFTCYEIRDDCLEYLAYHAPGLESLNVYYFNVGRVKAKLFPKIKDFSACEFWEECPVPTGKSPFAKVVKKQMELRKHKP